MSSSSLHRRLYDIFTKSQPAKGLSQPSSRTPHTPAPPSPQPPPPSSSSAPKHLRTRPRITRRERIRSMYRERELRFRTLVDNFKQSSRTSWFRSQDSLYSSAVYRLAAARQFSLIEEILEEQKKYKDITDEGFAVRIMCLYGRARMFDHAQKLFDELPQQPHITKHELNKLNHRRGDG